MDDFLGIKDEDLDLGGLTSRVTFTKESVLQTKKEIEEEQQRFKDQYGDDWFPHWWEFINPKPDYDEDIKWINTAIQEGYIPTRIGGFGLMNEFRAKKDARMETIYGDKFYELVYHEPNNPDINERLIQDALKTGKWKELPDCLQEEYHKRIKECETH